ncbi:MAG: calcineurin-like phosphoesterase C-terminal domain-containing protein [Thermoanaerobaculaceae bacterium]
MRRRGTDPLAVTLHKGPDLPVGREWADPYVTDHLFAVPASPGTSRVTIEATDRFGRVHTAEAPLAPAQQRQ